MSSRLIILRGNSGCGKTPTAKLLQKEQWISKDTVFEALRNAGVPECVIASAWYTAVTETDV